MRLLRHKMLTVEELSLELLPLGKTLPKLMTGNARDEASELPSHSSSSPNRNQLPGAARLPPPRKSRMSVSGLASFRPSKASPAGATDSPGTDSRRGRLSIYGGLSNRKSERASHFSEAATPEEELGRDVILDKIRKSYDHLFLNKTPPGEEEDDATSLTTLLVCGPAHNPPFTLLLKACA